MTEMYVTTSYLARSGDVDSILGYEAVLLNSPVEDPEIDTDALGVFDPRDDIVVISAAALNLCATYGDYPDDFMLRGDFGEEGDYDNYRLDWLYSMFRKLFIVTTNHELLHVAIDDELGPCETDERMAQEEWIIDRMGWQS